MNILAMSLIFTRIIHGACVGSISPHTQLGPLQLVTIGSIISLYFCEVNTTGLINKYTFVAVWYC